MGCPSGGVGSLGRMAAAAPGALTRVSAVLFASGAVIVPPASNRWGFGRFVGPLFASATADNRHCRQDVTRWRASAAFESALGVVCHIDQDFINVSAAGRVIRSLIWKVALKP